jgi:small subunit ribosomal protein S9
MEEVKTQKEQEAQTQKQERILATGRRKESVARVRLLPGKGEIIINGRPWEKYFPLESQRIFIRQPLLATNSLNKFKILAKVSGGGISGQAGALRLGIARALACFDPNLISILREKGFLTRDPRMKERKKYGQKGARKRFQWTKR